MKKIIILDNKSKNVYVFAYDENKWETGEDFITSDHHELEIHPTQCFWMIIDTLNIIIK